MTELHDKMRADYTAGAKSLTGWIDSKIKHVRAFSFFQFTSFYSCTESNSIILWPEFVLDWTLSTITRFGLLHPFFILDKNNEKSQKIVEQLDLSALFNNLALRLVNNKRPPFKPATELTLQAIDDQLGKLETAEIETSKRMHAELARQIKLHNMAKR